MGSGIVETNGDYEEDDYEEVDDDYQDFVEQAADSQGAVQVDPGANRQ